MPDFGPTNRALRQALNMMWQMGLMKERDKLALGRQEKYLTGLEDIGVQRHEQSMAQIKERFENELARDNVVKQLRARIYSMKRQGLDTSALEKQLQGHIYNRAFTLLEVGEMSPEGAARAAQTFTESAVTSILGQAATTARQKRQIKEVEVPKMKIEEDKLAIRGKEFGLEEKRFAAKGKEKAGEEWLRFVEDVEDHLRQEGVIAERIFNEALFGSGKVPDPLSPENRGQAYTYLGKIRIKLIEGRPLTTGDKRFLQTVRSTFQIEQPVEKGGGLVSPETGFRPGEATGIKEKADSMVDQNILQLLIGLYMEEGGLTEEVARRKAMNMMTQIR